MNVYSPNLLASWPGDETPAQLPAHPRVTSLFRGLYEQTCHDLQWIATTVKGIKQHEDEDVFDQLYRRNHVLCGFATLLALPKVAHTLAILDFTLDYAREIETFGQRSMDYVVQLLAETTRTLFDDFHTDGRSGRDLSDVLLECRAYLHEPLQQWLAPPPPVSETPERRPPAAAVAETQEAAPAPAVGVTSLARAAAPLVAMDVSGDDELEELHIPADKAGLVSDFCEESREHLEQIGHQLIALEDSAETLPLVNQVFRSVHTVKGGARLLQIRKMETLTHQLESLLDQVRAGARPVSAGLIDVLLEAKTLLERMVDEVASRGPIHTRIAPILQAIATLQAGTVPPAGGPPPAASPPPGAAAPAPGRTGQSVPPGETDARPTPSPGGETIRIPIEKLDDVLNTASEVFITRIRLHNDVTAIRSALQQFQPTLHRMHALDVGGILTRLTDANRRLSKDLWSLTRRKNGLLTPDSLTALVNRFHDELHADIARQSYATPEEVTLHVLAMEEIHKRLQKNVEHLEQLSGRLQTGAMGFRMVPIAQLLNRFPAEVREIGRQIGKKVHLNISGADTELDKVLSNQLADPLLHILRNAIDHGLESPEERQALGKPDTGQVTLRAYYQGSHVVVEVTDDGRGINIDKVLTRAVERGLVEPEHTASLTRQEIFALLCEPGFSTTDTVSTVSGRGVGMDVVQSTMAQIQGSLMIDSTPQQGTTIRMHLPLTLAVVGILLVEERFNQFAFPILQVEEILLLDKQDITQISANTMYNHRGTTLPLTTLSSLLDFPPSTFADDNVFLVILAEGEKKIGVLVDRVLGRQEVLIKNLGSLVKKVPYVMGCTILSDSRLVLILNAWEIVNARGGSKPLLPSFRMPDGLRSARQRHTVLVVDDSAVQRNNLCAILGHAGYAVETADNGFEGLKRVRTKLYAACCVDIIMPLMDGFEFVERLRRLADYSQTPIFFITNRTAQAERDRAASLGIREFFAKPVEAERLIETLDACCLRAAAIETEGALSGAKRRAR